MKSYKIGNLRVNEREKMRRTVVEIVNDGYKYSSFL
jgi:hypothetical protein